MVPTDSPTQTLYRFESDKLIALDYCDPADSRVLAADSWLVLDGRTLALPLHLQRFRDGVLRSPAGADIAQGEVDRFLDLVIERLPPSGAWFPRVELRETRGGRRFVYRERSAPERHRSVRLASFGGPDPRRHPTVKGPDLERLNAARTSVQPLGADEAVILGPQGEVVEGAYSALLWWRGDTLCLPDLDLPRVDSVTARSVLALATARATDVVYETVMPEDLDGLEVWAASALHGIRIATLWVDGPALAEQPGRLATWRSALDKLTRPVATLSA